MSKLARRAFLKASAAGAGGLALTAASAPVWADLPIPPATGRLYRSAQEPR